MLLVKRRHDKGLHFLKKFILIKLKFFNCYSTNIHTADGVSQRINGFVNLPVQVGDYFKIIKVLMVPSFAHSLILGSDFCELFNVILDYVWVHILWE